MTTFFSLPYEVQKKIWIFIWRISRSFFYLTFMDLLSLPDDIIKAILDKLRNTDLNRAMCTCRLLRSVGKTARMWQFLRQRSRLPPPKTSARKFKTDYDVFMHQACRSCRVNLGKSFGFCLICQRRNRRISTAFSQYRDARVKAASTTRRARTLQDKLNACLQEQTDAKTRVKSTRQVLHDM